MKSKYIITFISLLLPGQVNACGGNPSSFLTGQEDTENVLKFNKTDGIYHPATKHIPSKTHRIQNLDGSYSYIRSPGPATVKFDPPELYANVLVKDKEDGRWESIKKRIYRTPRFSFLGLQNLYPEVVSYEDVHSPLGKILFKPVKFPDEDEESPF